MLEFLKRPYPYSNDLKKNVKILFFVSVFIFVFLLFFQPFKLDALSRLEKIYLISGLGVVTFLSLSLNLLFIPRNFLLLENGILRKKYSGIYGYYLPYRVVILFIFR
ncbi:MAG: hypothetical protein U9R54_02755 [Bacteroidota bacterium]|nr:hypothetical protein [Bacteroidota bacterium]